MKRFWLLAVILSITTPVQALTAGPFSPGAAAQFSDGTLSWSNPNRVFSSNNQRASAFGSAFGGSTNTLQASNFNMNVPVNAIIEGITLEIERNRSTSNVTDTVIQLHNGTSLSSSASLNANWNTAESYVSFGGPTNLWGFGALTPAQVNSSAFRVHLRAFVSPSATASIDHIRLSIHFSVHNPIATNVIISPVNAFSTENLTISYTYNDDQAHAEGTTQIRWFLNNILQPAFNNLTSISSTFTLKNQDWRATVQPHDGITFGNTVSSPTKTIANSIPFSSTPTLTPLTPLSSDPLVTTHFYFDADGDPEDTPQVRWFRNGTELPVFNDLTTLTALATVKGDEWFYTLRPNDGEDIGALITSPTRTILNSPPAATDLILFPANPNTNSTLSAAWTYTDPDTDPSVGTQIRWFLNNVQQSQFDSTVFIPSSNTTRGQQWHFTILPNDGTISGPLQASPTATIQNVPPTVPTITLFLTNRNDIPTPPTTDLELNYTYQDTENDPESGTTILWYRNDILQPGFTNAMTLTGIDLDGASWFATVTPHDGFDAGPVRTSPRRSTAPNLPIGNWPLLLLITGIITTLSINRLPHPRNN